MLRTMVGVTHPLALNKPCVVAWDLWNAPMNEVMRSAVGWIDNAMLHFANRVY